MGIGVRLRCATTPRFFVVLFLSTSADNERCSTAFSLHARFTVGFFKDADFADQVYPSVAAPVG